MKKNTFINFFILSVVLMVFQLASCQSTRSLTDEVEVKNPYTVTMSINFAQWDTISYKYDAITFSDGIQKGKFKGRKFASKVRPHQPIKWVATVTNTEEKLEVILITVFRDPISGGDRIWSVHLRLIRFRAHPRSFVLSASACSRLPQPAP